MENTEEQQITTDFTEFLQAKTFACIAAKAAVARQQLKCFVAGHMACPKDDYGILQFLYGFIEEYRKSGEMYHSAAIIFKDTPELSETMFDQFLWDRLQALSDMDAATHTYDQRVQSSPDHQDFSFSLKQEAFFIIGMHQGSSRKSRQFRCPVLVFNPHAQFEQLRASGKYNSMKNTVRKRDEAISGSINPMLRDFGQSSEVYQYSGREYNNSWKCPLNIKHASR